MKQVNQCLILAAGNGSRLRSVSGGRPKPLVHFRGKPILEHVIGGAQLCGIDRFVIVVGYGAEFIRDWFQNRHFDEISVTFVNNADYHMSNGISALKAKEEIDGETADSTTPRARRVNSRCRSQSGSRL
jgi:choline kinase